MDAHEAATRQVGGDDAITTRIGAVALPLGIVLIAISEIFHPAREDPTTPTGPAQRPAGTR